MASAWVEFRELEFSFDKTHILPGIMYNGETGINTHDGCFLVLGGPQDKPGFSAYRPMDSAFRNALLRQGGRKEVTVDIPVSGIVP